MASDALLNQVEARITKLIGPSLILQESMGKGNMQYKRGS
jgi:hypothetical protein